VLLVLKIRPTLPFVPTMSPKDLTVLTISIVFDHRDRVLAVNRMGMGKVTERRLQ